jgi:hypothetical protein
MAATTTQTRREARSNADWDELARTTIVPRLAAGAKMTDIRAEFGSGATIRRALMRVGYDTKGQPTQVAKLAASKPQLLAKRVAERRAAGASWDRLALETGKTADELKALLAQHGAAELAAAKREAAAAEATKPKPAAKRQRGSRQTAKVAA